ncbi:MAG: hypothetical protein ABI113_18435 [Mucilaginibacter sp.]
MQPFLSKKSKIKFKIFGWYQIIGGIVGVLLTLYLLALTDQLTGLMMILYLIAFGLYSFSIYSGRILLGNNHERGLNLSILNQAMQVVSFTLLGYGFMYVSGMMFLVSIKAEAGVKINFNFSFTSTWHLYFKSDDSTNEFAINFLAIYLIYFADKLRLITKNEANDYQETQLINTNSDIADE